jgi:hypothetical protein
MRPDATFHGSASLARSNSSTVLDRKPELASAGGGDRAAVGHLRALAGRGDLAATVARAAPPDVATLTGAAYAVAWPVVYARLTRGLEMRRGHTGCARALGRLTDKRRLADPAQVPAHDECLDRFHDDVEAVVDDLLRNASKPIVNLEAWIAARLGPATVDGYRRRRGRRGALQRPRAPKWLCRALGDDPWMVDLAIQILVWVGTSATAGGGLWPLDGWLHRRAVLTNNWTGDVPTIVREIEAVLAAMRGRAGWYAAYVETPLGRKQAPVTAAPSSDDGRPADAPPLPLTHRYEIEDAHLSNLAAQALAAIERRLRRGEDPRTAVTAVLRATFGTGGASRDMDCPPHTSHGYDAEQVATLLEDPARVAGIVTAVLRILDADSPARAA